MKEEEIDGGAQDERGGKLRRREAAGSGVAVRYDEPVPAARHWSVGQPVIISPFFASVAVIFFSSREGFLVWFLSTQG